jgi:hypothetical protein
MVFCYHCCSCLHFIENNHYNLGLQLKEIKKGKYEIILAFRFCIVLFDLILYRGLRME